MSTENQTNGGQTHQAICFNCKFYLLTDAKNGLCRRYPPTIQIFPAKDKNGNGCLTPMVNYPVLTSAAWCGEFQEKSYIVAA